jgi:hypothetical protein
MGQQRQRIIVVAGTGVAGFMAGTVYAPLANALEAEVETLNGLGFAHTMRSVETLTKHIERGGVQVTLVGHSQGGLVAALIASQRPELVSTVVTLGAPLAGTTLCSLVDPLSGLRCMSRGSRLLGKLRPSARMHNVVGTADHLVVPYQSGLLPGAHHYVMDGVSHTGLIYNHETIQLVSEITQARTDTPAAPGARHLVAA